MIVLLMDEILHHLGNPKPRAFSTPNSQPTDPLVSRPCMVGFNKESWGFTDYSGGPTSLSFLTQECSSHELAIKPPEELAAIVYKEQQE